MLQKLFKTHEVTEAMDLGIAGKTAIICASSGGLGKASALELVKADANVVICGRTEKTLQATKDELESIGAGNVIAVVADVAEETGRKSILDAAHKAFDHVDILVTNSGGPPPGRFEDHDMQAWDDAYDLLLKSSVAMIKGVLPGMKAQKWGRIISVTSVAVKQPVANLILSNALRAAVTGMLKTLANELGDYNITVNSVMPGYTRTDRMQKLLDANPAFGSLVKEVALGRIGEPEEFGAMVAFLASARAGYITGVSIPVDGGAIKALV